MEKVFSLKKVVCLFIVILLLAGALVAPSFSYASGAFLGAFPSFTPPDNNANGSNDCSINDGLIFNSGSTLQRAFFAFGSDDLYVCAVKVSDTQCKSLVLSHTPNAAYGWIIYYFDPTGHSVNSNGEAVTATDSDSIQHVGSTEDSDYPGVYKSYGNFQKDTSLFTNAGVPVYDSLEEALAAFSTYSGVDPALMIEHSAEIPRGYVCYMEIGADVSADLYATMNDFSGASLLGFNQNLWVNDTRHITVEESLPSASTQFNSMVGGVEWDVSPNASYNIMRRTKDAYYHLNITGQSGYVVLLNPNLDQNGKENSSVYVKGLVGVSSFRLFPLTLVAGSTGVYSISESDFETVYSVDPRQVPEYGSLNEALVDQNGDAVEELIPGGTSYTEPVEEGTDRFFGFIDRIEGFFGRLLNVIGSGLNSIVNLVEAGADYMQHLSGLYAWLPPAVSEVIISALIVVVIVGVFKSLL